MKHRRSKVLGPVVVATIGLALAVGCRVGPPPSGFPRAESVDLDRYMGDWYVIAHIPPSTVEDSYDNLERYRRVGPDRIDIDFTYRDGGFDAELETLESSGRVVDGTGGAVWAVQFVWPFRSEYTIIHVDPGYRHAVVGRSKRDWVWILARTPSIDEATYRSLVESVAAAGYDPDDLRRVPQRPLSDRREGDRAP